MVGHPMPSFWFPEECTSIFSLELDAEAARRANSGRRNSRSTGNNSQSLRPRSIKFKSESFERTGRKIFLYFLPTKREYRDARRLPKFSMPSHRTFPGLSEDRPISVLPLKRG